MRRLYWGNCLGGAIYLWLRGKVSEIILISSTTKWWPYHYVTLNKRGQLLQFSSTQDSKGESFLAPFFYRGCFSGISKKRQEEVLKESGRVVIWRSTKVSKLMWLFIFVYSLLFIPVYFIWCFYPPFCIGRCFYHAWKVRK